MTNDNGKREEVPAAPIPEDMDANRTERATVDPDSQSSAVPQQEQVRPGWLSQFAARLQRPAEQSRDAKSGERTRGLVILTGTAIACIFLFFGLFTTDSSSNRKDRSTKPNLGRPASAATDPEAANRSPIPQISVTQQPNEESGELSEQDVLATMRNRVTAAPPDNIQVPPPNRNTTLGAINFDDPALAEAYRRQGLTPPRPAEATDWNAAITEYQATQRQPSPPKPVVSVSADDSLRKSSIVFVRASSDAPVRQAASIPAAVQSNTTGLLPQGTALVARLQHTVNSAAKSPVVAVIEYNYEQNGELIVPAGTKAYGELSQATPQGWVEIKFNTLEMPAGKRENIDASALSMERGPLRGDVNGKNTAKKFLTRTMTGIGTIAAFAVGGRGLTGGIDNSILLRERLSSNVALAGEQELARLAYQQNIVVTVPANTRFYLVLHASGVSRPTAPILSKSQQAGPSAYTETVSQTAARASLSEQELREMIQLRNELREMSRLMRLSSQNPMPTVPEN
ncbi:MAG: TrbI/VirB10 family protein [Acidobacteria bacterium]|nr:TrbI/VirB10 family protein [Acidobacteriota bacterium]